MPNTNDPQRALVVGGGRPGIGQAVTRRLVADGFEVYASYSPADAAKVLSLKEMGTSVQLKEVQHDSPDALRTFCAEIPFDLHAIVIAEFFFEMEPMDDFNQAVWDKSLFVNLTMPNLIFHETKAHQAQSMSFVAITSTEGFIGSFGAPSYAASKAAIHNLVKTLANNNGSRGVRANAVAAGWIGGVMDDDETFNMSRKITPLERLGAPEEIAAVVSFLCGPDASFVNGTVIVADGGYTGVDTIAKYEAQANSSATAV